MVRKVSVMDEKWNYLIVLDACRYDYFSNQYKDYFQGKLEKIYSQGSHTLEWCKKSFTKYFKDVIYVSANPLINSKVKVGGFDAKSHFFRVFDVWNSYWDDEFGTVHPQKINEVMMNLKDKYLDKRFIIHYLQPHPPFYSLKVDFVFHDPTVFQRKSIRKETINKIVKFLTHLSNRLGIFGPDPEVKIRNLLNLVPRSQMQIIIRKYGKARIRQAYMENLKLVLPYVANLVEQLSGVIVVSSDHGERLGENGFYGHTGGSTNTVLIEVPWLVIEKKEKRKDIEEKKMITEKIKRLKARNLI